MVVGVIKCTKENLVALVPQVISKFKETKVIVETKAGVCAGYSDDAYQAVGADVLSRQEVLSTADILLTCTGIEQSDLMLIKKDALLVGKFNARVTTDMLTDIQDADALSFSLDLLPRSSIAQSMDVLSSLASLSGYKAVLSAADEFEGYMPMMTTSAGTMPPAKVLVLGAGVAGLQAIATAKRLGAVVEAFDVRASVKEEVQSLGAKFIEVTGSNDDATAGGYAVEQTEGYIQKQKELIHQTALKADMVITTANIPGRKAPILIEERTVRAMKQGSVIVDMASASGGNCELSKDEQTIDVDGVKIIGDSKLYNQMGKQASLLYSNNIFNFLKFILKDGKDNLPHDSDIVSQTLLRSEEKVLETA